MDQAEYIKRVRSYIKTPTKEVEEQLDSFCEICTYIAGQYDQDEPFQKLDQHIKDIESGRPEDNRVFYMALPPSVFINVSQHLKRNCYPEKGIARVIIEKPFGRDLGTARELQRALQPDWKGENNLSSIPQI
jgi:glucose-6-phosphate 1-dehydrogenase